MPVRRVGEPSNGNRSDGGKRAFTRRPNGIPPVRKTVRNAKLAALPVAYAGRQAAGAGRRALGRPAAEVELDIQVRTAQHIFEVLGELKGCAAKLGQLLSIYELALPPELAAPYRTALAQLQDSTPTMLPDAVRRAMAASLGDSWQWYFREFDARSAASASIGQVHRGVWRDGRPVAVKVMFPGARASVLSDLEQLRRISLLATVFVPAADVKSVTEAICACVADELDYAAEAEYQRVFADAYADDPDFFVPRVIAQDGDVVVGEWVEGTPVSRLIADGPQSERDRVGLLIVRFLLSSWRRTGYLYTDPHPGNFRIMPDGRLGVLDFGACTAWPGAGFDELVRDICGGAVNGDAAEFEAAFRRHGFVDADRGFDVAAAHQAMAAVCEPMVAPTFRLSTDWLRRQVRRALNPQLSNVNRQLTMPAEFTPFARAILTALGVVCQLGTEGSIRDEFVRGSPELASEIARYDRLHAQPTDLAVARQRRAGGGPARPWFSIVG
ncbi:ABC1 kinase family protein [Nocardia mexicana]|uniref:Putative unusual protein kinase regulating ubiquinone biosynthesis (AarF/ABC1/UbiB family) n=1 Tax=Nocardia mexicana TaxID=279262 RepID=A0A370HFD9_9NOCA|nr:AarF/ABC1/UbiB kinase family protein [Nocardia mexicana]RDI55506.1 putative unusual protein kinase regulating ubiquinone biosynthesis (AarF/ABC1/UbiB family) [Nocardia mexicana]